MTLKKSAKSKSKKQASGKTKKGPYFIAMNTTGDVVRVFSSRPGKGWIILSNHKTKALAEKARDLEKKPNHYPLGYMQGRGAA